MSGLELGLRVRVFCFVRRDFVRRGFCPRGFCPGDYVRRGRCPGFDSIYHMNRFITFVCSNNNYTVTRPKRLGFVDFIVKHS